MGNLVTIAKALIALAEVLPFARILMDKITDLWAEKEIEKAEGERASLLEKRKALIDSIKDAKTDEQRKALSIMLADITRDGKL